MGSARPILLLLAALLAPCVTAQTAEEAAVRGAFSSYRDAALAGDAGAALAAVSASTVAHYDTAVGLAVEGDSAAVAALPSMDRLLVFALRTRIDPDLLRRLDGARALMLGIKRGWIDADTMRRQSIGEVDIEGDLAVGGLLVGGERAGDVWVRFVREDGGWRVDLLSMFDLTTYEIDRAARLQRADPNDLVFQILAGALGRPVPPSVWHPVGRD